MECRRDRLAAPASMRLEPKPKRLAPSRHLRMVTRSATPQPSSWTLAPGRSSLRHSPPDPYAARKSPWRNRGIRRGATRGDICSVDAAEREKILSRYRSHSRRLETDAARRASARTSPVIRSSPATREVEQPTARELEVLQLVAEGYTTSPVLKTRTGNRGKPHRASGFRMPIRRVRQTLR